MRNINFIVLNFGNNILDNLCLFIGKHRKFMFGRAEGFFETAVSSRFKKFNGLGLLVYVQKGTQVMLFGHYQTSNIHFKAVLVIAFFLDTGGRVIMLWLGLLELFDEFFQFGYFIFISFELFCGLDFVLLELYFISMLLLLSFANSRLILGFIVRLVFE